MYQPKVTVKTAAEVKEILGKDFPSQVAKIIDHIDSHCRAWIERCPFVVISSTNATGSMDVSPKGDPPGFVKVLDKHTLAVPDRMGNHRGDTFLNVLENPSVGLLFIVPKRREVVRVSGVAQIVRDPELLECMAVKGKLPELALLVRVREAFFHCGKSMIRSGMWEPDHGGPSTDCQRMQRPSRITPVWRPRCRTSNAGWHPMKLTDSIDVLRPSNLHRVDGRGRGICGACGHTAALSAFGRMRSTDPVSKILLLAA